MENHVSSLELSKKLEELGVNVKSQFYWATFRNESSPVEQWGNTYSVLVREDEVEDYQEREYLKDKSFIHAYLSSELGEMLPAGTSTRKGWGMDSGYVMFDNEANKICSADTEADARAKMLIYLAENGLIDPKNI